MSQIIKPDNPFKDASLYLPFDKMSSSRVATNLLKSNFTRGSSKWVLNKNGVLEEIPSGFLGISYESEEGNKGCLIEPAGTNLFERSEEFDNAYWTKFASSVVDANTAIAPDGLLTADRLRAATNAASRINRVIDYLSLPDNSNVAMSLFAKKDTTNTIRAGGRDKKNNIYTAIINLDTLETFSVSTGLDVVLLPFPNNWIKCVLSWNIGSGSTTSSETELCRLLPSNAVSLANASEGDSVFIWGAQLEEGSVATSYIKTTDATATRNADVIEKTDAGGLIGQTEGTVFFDVESEPKTESTDDFFRLGTGDNGFRFDFRENNELRIRSRDDDNTIGDISTLLTAEKNKIAIVYTASDFTLYINGTEISFDSRTVVAIDNIQFRNGEFNGHLKSFALYKRALSEAEAIALTTL